MIRQGRSPAHPDRKLKRGPWSVAERPPTAHPVVSPVEGLLPVGICSVVHRGFYTDGLAIGRLEREGFPEVTVRRFEVEGRFSPPRDALSGGRGRSEKGCSFRQATEIPPLRAWLSGAESASESLWSLEDVRRELRRNPWLFPPCRICFHPHFAPAVRSRKRLAATRQFQSSSLTLHYDDACYCLEAIPCGPYWSSLRTLCNSAPGRCPVAG